MQPDPLGRAVAASHSSSALYQWRHDEGAARTNNDCIPHLFAVAADVTTARRQSRRKPQHKFD